jgi:hypothetical protein
METKTILKRIATATSAASLAMVGTIGLPTISGSLSHASAANLAQSVTLNIGTRITDSVDYVNFAKTGLATTKSGGELLVSGLSQQICSQNGELALNETIKLELGVNGQNAYTLTGNTGTTATSTVRLKSNMLLADQYIDVTCAAQDAVKLALSKIPALESLSTPFTLTYGQTSDNGQINSVYTLNTDITPTTKTINVMTNFSSVPFNVVGIVSVSSSNLNVLDATVDQANPPNGIVLKPKASGIAQLQLVLPGKIQEVTVIVHPHTPIPQIDLSKFVAYDAQDTQFKDAIFHLFQARISTGIRNSATGEVYFLGDQEITREQVALMLYRLAQPYGHAVGGANFNDVSTDNQEVYNAILFLKTMGISSGVNGNFYPKDKIRRDQLAKLLTLTITTLDDARNKGGKFTGFSDITGTSDTDDYIKFLGATKISLGADGKFYPEHNISRGQTAQFMYNAYRYLQNEANPL